MKVYMNIDFSWLTSSVKKSDGARQAMQHIEKQFEKSPLASMCKLEFISASYNRFRRCAALMYWIIPTDERAYNVLKLKWSDNDWEAALDTFSATQVRDDLEDDHFGVLVDMEE